MFEKLKGATNAFRIGFRTAFHLMDIMDRNSRFADPALLSQVKASGIRISWAFFHGVQREDVLRIRRHRALSLVDNEPVTGYLWAGSDHTYIIPDTCGVCYDEETKRLTAHAIEVNPLTAAVESPFLDDETHTLFDGDIVAIGNEEFELCMSSAEALSRLNGPDRKELGVHRRKKHYEVLRA